MHRKFFIYIILSHSSNVQCSNVYPEVSSIEKSIIFQLIYSEPFPDDAPRPLQDKALHMYAVANINERTRKEDK
jgi:hypothetical protein